MRFKARSFDWNSAEKLRLEGRCWAQRCYSTSGPLPILSHRARDCHQSKQLQGGRIERKSPELFHLWTLWILYQEVLIKKQFTCIDLQRFAEEKLSQFGPKKDGLKITFADCPIIKESTNLVVKNQSCFWAIIKKKADSNAMVVIMIQRCVTFSFNTRLTKMKIFIRMGRVTWPAGFSYEQAAC